MIVVVTPEHGRFGIENYLRSRWRVPGSAELTCLSYDALFRSHSLAPGTWIFTGAEQLPRAGQRLAQEACTVLRSHGQRVLNEPAVIADRLTLLERLHAAGINDFRAYRADALPDDVCYPVFIREANDHTGSLSPLLRDRNAVAGFLRWQRIRGLNIAGLLVIEFCDTADPSGLFRKYSSFHVAGTTVARHLHFDRQWVVKAHAQNPQPAWAAEELDYIRSNPHAEEIDRVFALAGIDYGRVDYGLRDSRIQVWEINTNPTFGPGPVRQTHTHADEQFRALQAPGKRLFYDRFAQCLADIDSSFASDPIPFAPSEAELDALAKERSATIRALRPARVASTISSLIPRRLRSTVRNLISGER